MTFKKKLKRIIENVIIKRKKKQFFAAQKNTFNVSKKILNKAKKSGFTADEYVIHRLDQKDPQDYISEFERHLQRDAAREYRILLDNKVVFYNLIRNFADTNTIYAFKENGNYVNFVEGYEENIILFRLRENGKMIYKDNNNGGGKGVYLFEFKNGEYYLNRQKCLENEIIALILKDNYILEEYCEQSEFENSLYPYSVNTIRLVTVEIESGKYKAIKAIQRMGLDKNNCVDNASMGGLYSEIDINSGMMSVAVSHSIDRIDFTGRMCCYSKHPISDAQIESVIIPNWKSIVKNIEALHNCLSFTGIPFIAWDVALTKDGFKIIEANTSCGMDIAQIFQGERNRTLGRWMKERGYIK